MAPQIVPPPPFSIITPTSQILPLSIGNTLLSTCPPLTYYATHSDNPVVVVLNNPSLCHLPTLPPIVAHGSITLIPDHFPTSIFHSTSGTSVTVTPAIRPFNIPTETLTPTPSETLAPESASGSIRYIYLLVLIFPVVLGIFYVWSVWKTNQKTRREDREGTSDATRFSRARSYARWLKGKESRHKRLL
ncbi:hypothetical protein L211DRAFT_851506 [Terfezia boudieri ATCC MYA-4762]|uniref:Uncharacterized protein n=1 Tax=Terfezia boudieri ATCC MYA-4762 TaxID=1051890 RepID=A0A3N4LEL5_9PEZI|nr:hypothetical protein L211DRAFT_851506 [Terfezia boudieri ATCC MYA-4762]